MCYNAETSFAFFAVGIALVTYIYTAAPRLRATNIQWLVLFYTLEELLQTAQYWSVNECERSVNRYLTEVAYVFIIVQPLMWNVYYYKLPNTDRDRGIFTIAIVMSLIWMAVNVLARLLYMPNYNPQTEVHSVFAGKLVCTRRMRSHLYWEWTSFNLGDVTPDYLTYLMLWFVPGFASSHYKTSLFAASLTVIAAFVTFLSGEVFIFPSVWCFISVPLMGLLLANIYLFGG